MHSPLGREWHTLVEAGRTVVGEQRGEELPFGLPQVLVERGPADVEVGRQLLGRDIDALDDWGFDLVIFPVLATLSTIAAVHADMQAFADDPVAAMRGVDDAFDAAPVGSLHEFSGFPEVVEWEERYLPPEDQEKYEGSLGDEVSGNEE